ncbi:aquaporin-10-like [Diadema setosum]|uniref:aquaporin-10-like n=1 Tax=Diadema setosum TaxID=31175 RepID=UPI003B3BD6BC
MAKPSWIEKLLKTLTIKDELLRFMLCEFYATMILALFAHAVVAQETVSRSMSGFNMAFGSAMGVSLAVYSGFGVSGGHVNLALSVGIAVIGVFPWRRIPFYFVSQLAGGFVGSALVYLVYKDAFDEFDGGTRQVLGENGTAAIFATFPQPYLSVTTGFFEQVLNTALLLAAIGGIMDHRNNAPPLAVAPFFFGIIVFTILMSYAYNAGAPLNPSLDLSGRLLLTAVGYGPEVWVPNGVHWWWIPIVGPTIGSALGSWAYFFAITLHHPPLTEDPKDMIQHSEATEMTGEVGNSQAPNSCENSTSMTEFDVNHEKDREDRMSGPLCVDVIYNDQTLVNESTNDVFL